MLYSVAISYRDALKSILTAKREYEQIAANFDDFISGINASEPPQDRRVANIVLVIGESAQRNLMQIYGYYLPNTPILSALQRQKPENLLVFDDVISPQVATFEALSQVLTFANQDSLQTPWYRYLNIIDAMRLGGYKSVVISNQEQFSLWAKATTTIFSRADALHWTRSAKAGNILDTMKPDGAVVEILDEVLEAGAGGQLGSGRSGKNQTAAQAIAIAQSTAAVQSTATKPITAQSTAAQTPAAAQATAAPAPQPLFTIIHLMGSHATYYNRYPREFDRFGAGDVRASRGRQAIAEYANSILYTDFVLGEIIKRFANSDSVVIYFSDHAEDVYDTGDKPLRLDANPTRFMVEIPFMVYASDEFIAKHPQIHARLKAATSEPFMSDDLMHTIIDIAGFDVSGFEPRRSLISDDKTFLRQRARLVGTQAARDYDKELKNQPRRE